MLLFGRPKPNFAIFVGLYFASGYLPASNAVKLAVLALGASLLFAMFARTKIALVLAVAAAIGGPLVEILLVSQGAFRHLQPDVLGIPIWLPALYATGSLAFGLMGHRLHHHLKEKGGAGRSIEIQPDRTRGRRSSGARV